MANLSPKDIRNVAIIGHSSSGKTTLADALLFNAKITNRFGKVDEGTSIFDYNEEEINRKISISSSIAQFNFRNKKINLIDTPGYVDFIGEPLSALRAVDIAVAVVDGVEGVQFNTIKLLNIADKDELSKIIFINKLDKENTQFDNIIENIKSILKVGVMPLTIPIQENNELKGVINVFENKAYYLKEDHSVEAKEIPDSMKNIAEDYRIKMIEAIAETDDALIEKYFDEGTLSEEEIHKGLIDGLLKGKITPVFAGSALLNVGVFSLIDFIVESTPSPVERKPVKAIKVDDNSEIECKCQQEDKLKAFVFKTVTEPHIGEMNFVRVFSGTIRYGDEVYNSNKEVTEKIGQIFNFIGKEKKEVKEVIAGDICVLVKLKNTNVSDTLCSLDEKIKFPEIQFPSPLMHIAIVPQSKADEDKLSTSISKLIEEDPTIHVRIDPELKQTIVSGMGEIQLDIFVSNLKNKYNVNIEVEKPKIPYRETIKKKAKAQGKYKKQTGGRGQYGDCWVEIEPLPLNYEKDFEFVDKIVGGAIPGKYIPSVEKGIKEAMAKGILAGYPIIKVRATLYDGSFHPVDSSDIAFQIAGSLAFKNAAANANLTLLEPIMKLKIYTPEKYMGDVMSDLNSRRGKISGMEDEAGLKVINAYVPQAELYKYINQLKSITQGSGTYEREFSHYEEVPHDIKEKIIAEAKKEE